MSRQNKKKPIVNTEINTEPKIESSVVNTEPVKEIMPEHVEQKPVYVYLGITDIGSYFHVDDDPNECIRITKTYCSQNEAYDIFQICTEPLDCKRIILNGYQTMFGRGILHK